MIAVEAPVAYIDPAELPYLTNPADLERFLGHVEILPNGCWRWTRRRKKGMTNGGYPHFRIKENGKWRTVIASRWILLQKYGPNVMNGRDGDHRCHLRSCVRLGHLQPLGHRENVQRQPTGSKSAKLRRWLEEVWEYARLVEMVKAGKAALEDLELVDAAIAMVLRRGPTILGAVA